MDNGYLQKLKETYSSMYDDWIKVIENYKINYEKQSGIVPSDRLMVAFCRFRRIPYPIPEKERFIREMVNKIQNR